MLPGPAYRIAFSARFRATTRSIRGRTSAVAASSPSRRDPHARTRRVLLELAHDLAQHGQHRLGAERDDARAGLELGEEEHLVDQLADLLDLAARLLDELLHVLARQQRELEQRQQPRERRPQLVRHRGGEAGAQLLVGGEVAHLGQVDEPLAPAVDGVRHDERALALQQLRGALVALAHASSACRARRLAATTRPASSRTTTASRLSSEQHLAAHRVRVHHSVTTPSPRESTFDLHHAHVAKVLIIEDDDVIAQGMARHLTAAGFDAVGVANGETGLARLRYEQPDVCVLDLMLPGVDGWRVIEQARSEGIGTPIVVVSARGTEHDRINALELGADDYLVKPFSMKELVARVAAAARRGTRAQEPRRGEEINVEELRLDPRNVQAYVDGASANLTPTEFRLLYALALDQGRVLTRDELLQRVWGRRASHRDRTVDVFVRKLREKVDARAPRHTFLQTRYGVGYKLEAEPKVAGSAADVEDHERAARDARAAARRLREHVAWLRIPACDVEREHLEAGVLEPSPRVRPRRAPSRSARCVAAAAGSRPSRRSRCTVEPRLSCVPAGWACATILPCGSPDGT